MGEVSLYSINEPMFSYYYYYLLLRRDQRMESNLRLEIQTGNFYSNQ